MSTFIQRIKKDFNDPRNNFKNYGNKVVVDRKDLLELIGHFESLDSAVRSKHDSETPFEHQNRYSCLAHEVQAAFHNIGVEETLDVVMFTLSELRKWSLKGGDV
ncbi:MAG: hypothetical protein ABNH21_06810 [Glaciecola sp.]